MFSFDNQGLFTFQETKRPSKEMQVTIARQLGLEPTTVGNFFMNARRRSHDKWRDGPDDGQDEGEGEAGHDNNIKYEVYDCGEGMGDDGQGYSEYEDQGAYHHNDQGAYQTMAAIPGPVHSTHIYPTST